MENKSRALVTGGEGFIGGHVVQGLRRKRYTVSTYDLVNGQDIRNPQAVAEAVERHDIIFHLAGVLGTHELNRQVRLAVDINITGTVNVLEAAERYKRRVVLVAKPNPWLNVYSTTKGASENLGRIYAKPEIGNTDVRIGRFFSVYGPKQKKEGVQKAVPTFIMKALQNEPLPVFGSGEQTADHIFVTDATQAFILLGQIDGLQGQTVEIGTGKAPTVNFLAEKIIELTGSSSTIAHLPMRTGEPENSHVQANPSSMITLLQFKPQVSLEDGLRETINWYKKEYLDSYRLISVPQVRELI